MRKLIRILALFSIFTIAVVLSGGLFGLYAVDFSKYPYYETSPSSEAGFRTELTNIEKVFDEYGLRWFAVCQRNNGEQKKQIHLYCTEDVREYLEKQDCRKSGQFVSLFQGEMSIQYHDWKEFIGLRSIPVTYRIYVCEPIGNNVPDELFRHDGDLKKMSSDFGKLIRILHTGLWLLTGAIVVLISAIHAHFEKKEWLIRRTYGASGRYLFTEALIWEIGMLIVTWLLPTVILYRYSAWKFQTGVVIGTIALSVVIIAFLYYRAIFRMDYKSAMQRSMNSNRISGVLEFIRIALFVISVFVISRSYVKWNEYKLLEKQEDFYQYFRGYSHLQLSFEAEEDIMAETCFYKEDEVYSETFSIWDIIQWKSVNLTMENDSYRGIYANSHAYSLLNEIMKEKEEFCLPEKQNLESDTVYVFLPESLKGLSEQKQRRMLNQVSFICHETEKTVVNYYKTEIKTRVFSGPGLNLESDTGEIVNPIIIFDNTEQFPLEIQRKQGLLCDFTMAACRVEESELEQYVFQTELIRKGKTVNIYETYQKRLLQLKDRAITFFIIGCITVFMNLLLFVLFVKMKQRLDAVQYAVMRVTGSPFAVRHKSTLRATFIAAVAGTVISVGIDWITRGSISYSVFSVALILALADMIVLLIISRRWERMSLVRILKGGAL